jgi:putative PIN family toxin of toxin-antitoxin system
VKVFIDTNVWLSGRFWPGLCAELLDTLIMLDVTILLDARVLEEFRRIARDKLKVDDDALQQAEVFFHRYALALPAAEAPAPDIPDPDDAWIIAAALAAGADWFVTGDRPLLSLGGVADMPILDPRSAYMRLRGLH